MTHVLLFDVDSVLVNADAYLRALQDTVAHFSAALGVGHPPPTEAEIRIFEAQGMGCEWESGALCVAALLLARVAREPAMRLPDRWSEALAGLGASPRPLPRPDYAKLARQMGRRLATQPNITAAAHALMRERARAIDGLAPHTGAALDALLDALFADTHDFYRAPVTRYFQHLTLGHGAVGRTYGIEPDFESPVYLERYDRSLLTPATRDEMERRIDGRDVRVAIYTARPSLPPAESGADPTGYSPEAEIARSLAGMERYPILGLGKLRWLAHHLGERVDYLVKPSPVQALAAIGLAWAGHEVRALEAALALYREGDLRPPLAEVDRATVHVFEDSTRGIAGVQRALEILRAAGCDVRGAAYGIVPPATPKAAAMTERGIPTYPTVNEGVRAALDAIEGRG
jgi:hypothetical protein